uniref:uncharacterized protein n=1 Tax=Semicossyphus pulcher TaxID=241346 RepID=UPI0037E99037
MTPPGFVLYLTCLILGETAHTTALKSSSSVHQESGFVSVKTGESLLLQCFYEGGIASRLYWYKHTLGQKPRIISTFFLFDRNGSFHGEFKSNPRFTLDTENSQNHLKITDLHISDSATYYCISSYLSAVDISETIYVNVRSSGLNVPVLVQQSASETVQPGGSVTLNCSVHTGTCDGEHSVYWFKNSEESHPGLIYTHGGRTDQCEREPNTETNTCVYNLPMRSLNLSHAGTYYCAVVSCGQILFGNGTKLDLKDSSYLWSGALTFTTFLVVLLAFSVCMMNKRNSCKSTASSTAKAQGYQNTHHLYYAALSVKLNNRSRTGQRDPTWSECVYHSLKQ